MSHPWTKVDGPCFVADYDGGTLEKTKEGDEAIFDSGASSTNLIHQNSSNDEQGITWKTKFNDKAYVIGLGTDPTDRDRMAIDFELYCSSSNTLYINERGARKFKVDDYQAGDRLAITVNGTTVKYWRNDTIFYSSQKIPNFPLAVECAFYSPGARAENVRLLSSSTKSEALMGGAITGSPKVGSSPRYGTAQVRSNKPRPGSSIANQQGLTRSSNSSEKAQEYLAGTASAKTSSTRGPPSRITDSSLPSCTQATKFSPINSPSAPGDHLLISQPPPLTRPNELFPPPQVCGQSTPLVRTRPPHTNRTLALIRGLVLVGARLGLRALFVLVLAMAPAVVRPRQPRLHT
jgi:hypothetical protein